MTASYDAKLERAKERLHDLYAEVRAFLDTDPYGAVFKHDKQTGHHRTKIAFEPPAPMNILIIAGDVLHNLRCALDHLYWDLAHARLKPPPATEDEKKGLQFPICKSAKSYSARVKEIGRLGPDVLKVFDALKPYQGGDDTLWRLNELSNRDKHRTLLTVGFKTSEVRFLKKSPPPPEAPLGGGATPAEVITSVTIAPPFPLKDGDILPSGISEAEATKNVHTRYCIAFNEPGGAEGVEVVSTLAALFDRVDEVIELFRPLI